MKLSPSAARIGIAELRGNLARYLGQAEAGRPVIIQGRGQSLYALMRIEEKASGSVLGCMRERTTYTAGAVVGSAEEWSPGPLP